MIESTKERIIAPWLLGLLAVLLAAALYTMRPSQDTMAGILASRPPSDLSVAYLRNWLKVDPRSPRLMALLAQQYVGLGRWDDAQQVAVRLIDDKDSSESRQQGVRLYLQALEQHAYTYPPGDERRKTLLAQVDSLLRTLASSEDDVPTLAYLVNLAQGNGAPETTWLLYQRLAEKDPARAASWYSLQGQRAQADGLYAQAAQAYFNAQAHSTSRTEQRRSFLAALAALEAGNQVAQACDQAEAHLGDLADDPQTLRYLIELARKAQRYDLMRRHGEALAKLLAFAPPRYSDGLNGAQALGWMPAAQLLLAASDAAAPSSPKPDTDLDFLYQTFVESHALSDAQNIAQRALDRKGADRRLWLTRLAQVAEWNGKPAIAMKAWDALAQEFNDPKAWDNVRRLAPQLGDDSLWVDALKQSLASRPDDAVQTGQLLAAYERSGDGQAAAGLLKRFPAMQGSHTSTADVASLAALVDSARQAGARTTLLPVYERLAQADTAQAAHWYSVAGQLAQSAGLYSQAAQAYFGAQAHARALNDQRTAFIAALNALRAGNQVADACVQAEAHVGNLAQDRETLRFLIGLAREAERYDLMRKYGESLSHLLSFAPRYLDGPQGAVRLGWVARPHLARVADVAGTAPPPSATAADLDLLYQTFLESNALSDALATAQKALARPDVDRRLWLTRLAQVAEWDNQPKIALKAWRALAEKYDDAKAWQQLLRLSPQMQDEDTWLKALHHAAEADPGNFQLVADTAAAYERVGNPEGGLAFLRGLGTQDRRVLELQAALAERAEHDDQALDAWRKLQRRYGPSPVYALHIATLLYAHRQPEQALAALQEAREAARQHNTPPEFWKTYLSLARLLGDQEGQKQAIASSLAQHTATPADFDNFLYLYDGTLADKGRIAEVAFQQTGDPRYLAQALTAYTQIRATGRAQKLLADLSPEALQRAQQLPAFLEARAGLRQAANDPRGALRDLRQAYALPGGVDTVGQSYLWALLSFGTREEARRVTDDLVRRHGSQPDYAPVLAAAMLQLDQPQRALNYMNIAGVPSMQDPLWLMSYAAAQQALGRSDVAWRIRRKAWQLLAARRASLRTQEAQVDLVSLGQVYQSGDVSLALLVAMLRDGPPDGLRQSVARSILGDVRGIPSLGSLAQAPVSPQGNARRVDAAVYALKISWAMDGGHQDLARAWLANRYVSDMLKPSGGRLALALLDNDRDQLARLLERDPADLAGDDRAQALDRLGRIPEAQTEAFTALAGAPDNDDRYDNWQDVALKQRPSAGLRVEYGSLRPLETTSVIADAGMKLTDHLGLKVRHTERFNRSLDKDQMAWVPGRDQESSLALLHADANHRYELEVGLRDSLASQTTGLLTAAWLPDSRWNLTLQAGVNQYTDVDSWLAVGGSKDFVSANIAWDSQRDWFASLEAERARYQTQQGQRLGTGAGVTGTLGYHLKREGLPVDLSVYTSRWAYSYGTVPIPDFARFMPNGEVPNSTDIMPQNTTQYGVTLSLGNDQITEYQRGWRPYLAVSMQHDSLQGWGPGVSAGVGGSLLGRDRLGFYVTHEPASQGGGETTTRVGLYYRFFY